METPFLDRQEVVVAKPRPLLRVKEEDCPPRMAKRGVEEQGWIVKTGERIKFESTRMTVGSMVQFVLWAREGTIGITLNHNHHFGE